MADLVTVYRAAHITDAHLIRNFLAEFGIEGIVLEESITEGRTFSQLPTVCVSRDDVVSARRLIEEREKNQRFAQANPGVPGPWYNADADDIEDEHTLDHAPRPTCPQCGEARTTVCPYCKTASNSFPIGDAGPGGERPSYVMELPIVARGDEPERPQGETMLLVCDTCDEPFDAEFLRRCEWCGHDFGHGSEAPIPARQASHSDSDLNWRVVIGIAALMGALGGLALFFKIVFSRN